MSFKCKFGLHTWNGCKCTECTKTRDEHHDWSYNCEKCLICGIERNNAHSWDYCICTTCGKKRNQNHNWSDDGEICTKCGETGYDFFLGLEKIIGRINDYQKLARSINLSRSKLQNYSFLSGVKVIKELYLSNNEITDSTFLKDLKNLKILDISHNKLADLSFLKELTKLNTLYLNDNKKADNSFLKELKGLTNLSLTTNQIIDLSLLKELKGLTYLRLDSHRQIEDLSFLKELKGLTNLSLTGMNGSTDFSVIQELKGLKELDLSYNELTDISFLKELKGLDDLDLSLNKLTDVSCLSELKALKKLNLSHNNISDVSFLKDINGLKIVKLTLNKIYKFPDWLYDSSLNIFIDNVVNTDREGIYIFGNPLEKNFEQERNIVKLNKLKAEKESDKKDVGLILENSTNIQTLELFIEEWDLYGINVSPESANDITLEMIKERMPDLKILSENNDRYEIARNGNYKVLFYISTKGGLKYVIINGEADVSFLSLKKGSPISTLKKMGWSQIDNINQMGIQAFTFKKNNDAAEIQIRINTSNNTIIEIHYDLKNSNG